MQSKQTFNFIFIHYKKEQQLHYHGLAFHIGLNFTFLLYLFLVSLCMASLMSLPLLIGSYAPFSLLQDVPKGVKKEERKRKRVLFDTAFYLCPKAFLYLSRS